MRYSNLIRTRRRYIQRGDKKIDEIGSTSFFSSLTQIKVNDRIKKDRQLFTVDQEGNIKEISKNSIKKTKNLTDKKVFDFLNLGIGYYLVTPIVLGVFLGLGLDYWFKTNTFFFILFLILGTLASFYNIFKLIKGK